jgi:hypothetical protein
VDDTEPAEEANYDCPAFPHRDLNACGSGPDGEMYMNYMDYVDDDCMNMFTIDQCTRMDAALNGPRAGLLNSLGCGSANGISKVNSSTREFEIFPNPANHEFTIRIENNQNANYLIRVYDMSGKLVLEKTDHQRLLSISTENIEPGVYHVSIVHQGSFGVKRLTIVR